MLDNAARPASALIARDRRALLGSLGLSLMGQGGAFIAGLLCMVLTVRLLGPVGYGGLAMFFLLLAFFSQLLVAWPNLGLVRFGRAELGESGRIGSALAARALLLALCLMAAAALLFLGRGAANRYLDGVHLAIPGAPALGAAVLLLVYLALNETVFAQRALFQTVSRFRAYAWNAFLVRALILVALAGAFLMLKWEPTAGRVVALHCAALALAATISLAWVPWRQALPLPGASEIARAAQRMAAYSWPLMFGGLSVLMVDWVDLTVIRHFRPEAEVGLYAAAYQTVIVLAHLRIAAVGAVMPLIVSMTVEKRHDALRWAVDEALPQAAWTAGLGLTLIAGFAEAIPWVLGANYTPSVAPTQALMPGVGFSVLAALQAAVAHASDRVRGATAALVALAVLNALLDVVLVPRWGMLGAAAATSMAFALSGLLFFPLLNTIGPLRPARPARRYAMLAAMLPVTLFAIAAAHLDRPLHRLAACAALLVAGAATARIIGVFRRSTLERLDAVAMPRPARRALRWFYGVMGG